jgi:phage terminase large subunit-like protein
MTTTAERVFARRIECEEDGLYFNRYFMKQRLGSKMLIGQHHPVVQAALDRTMLHPDHPDFISRLIINLPPGYTKTEQACISYMGRGLGINPGARFLHLSYSHNLALLNSSTTRMITRSPEYQSMWPIKTRDDNDSKSMWWTTEGGGVYATSSGGQVMGFRAGHMNHVEVGFCGALVIDDPVKADDAYSEIEREKVNNRFNETIASRLAVESIPIIVIMQRIHPNDLVGYLLKGGSGEHWHHLNLPVILASDTVYPSEYTHGIPIDHGLPDGWLWEFKHNEQHETALRSHRRKFAAQYMQAPIKRNEETALWSESVMAKARCDVPDDDPIRTVVSVDPATTNNATSDEHGILVASKHTETSFSVDGDYTCKGSPKTWADRAIAAYDKHEADAIVIETNQGGDMCESTLRNAGFRGRVIRVHASKGKVARAEPIAALYELGYVKHRTGLLLLEDEMLDLDSLTGKANGKSPNRVDALVWALSELSIPKPRIHIG